MTTLAKQHAYRIVVDGTDAGSIDATCQEEAFARAKRLHPKHERLDVLPSAADLYAAAEAAAHGLALRMKPLTVWERLRVMKIVLG